LSHSLSVTKNRPFTTGGAVRLGVSNAEDLPNQGSLKGQKRPQTTLQTSLQYNLVRAYSTHKERCKKVNDKREPAIDVLSGDIQKTPREGRGGVNI